MMVQLFIDRAWKPAKIQKEIFFDRLYQSAQAVITKYHRQGGLNNRNLLFIVLEAGKSKIKLLANLVPGENSPSGEQTPSHCILT